MPIRAGMPIEVLAPVGLTVLPWNSEVLEVREDCFEIRRPDRRWIKLPTKAEGSLQLIVTSGEGLHTMTCKVLGGDTQRVILVLPDPQDVKLVQRRRHVRVPVVPPQAVTLRCDPEWNLAPISGKMIDISEAGCRICLDTMLMEGLSVQVQAELEEPERGQAMVSGTIVYFCALPEGNLVGIRFDTEGEVPFWKPASAANG